MQLLYCGTHEYEDGSKTCYLTEWLATGRLIITNFLNPKEQISIRKDCVISHDDETDTYILKDEATMGLKTAPI